MIYQAKQKVRENENKNLSTNDMRYSQYVYTSANSWFSVIVHIYETGLLQ